MTVFYVTGIYAAIAAVMVIILSAHVSMMRAATNTSILDGGNTDLALRIRRHGNFIENAPLTLILMLVAELDGVSHMWIHAAGVLLVAGRVLHAVGLRADAATPLRIAGGLGSLVANLLMIGNIFYLMVLR
jgi:uncharacterized protein